jgi:hypothetical protein
VNNQGLAVFNGVRYGDSHVNGQLYQLNPSTGVVTYAPKTFNLQENGFGSTNAGLYLVGVGNNPNSLYSVDPVSGPGGTHRFDRHQRQRRYRRSVVIDRFQHALLGRSERRRNFAVQLKHFDRRGHFDWDLEQVRSP